MELQQQTSQYEELGVAVVAAAVQDVETSTELAQRLDVSLPILADTHAEVAKSFGIFDLPGGMGPFSTHSFWLIDQDGTIRYREVSLDMYVPLARVTAAVVELTS